MEDLEMAKTEQWKNLGEYKKDDRPETGWIERNRRKMDKQQQGQSRRLTGIFVK